LDDLTRPRRYCNLKAHPEIEVELGIERFCAILEELAGGEWDRACENVVGWVPELVEYERNSSGSIPILRVGRKA
jgi:hypothetical protein